MATRRRGSLLWVWGVVLGASATVAEPPSAPAVAPARGHSKANAGAEGEYQSPERFRERQQPEAYLPYAVRFLANHREYPEAPRVLLEMLQVATVYRRHDLVPWIKARLLLEHPTSLPAIYLLRSSQAGDIRTILKDQFVRPDIPLDRGRRGQFVRAIGLCHREYGPAFVDDDVWVMLAVSVDERSVAERCRQQIRHRASDAARTLAIRLQDEFSARDRYLVLQPLRSYALARTYQQYVYDCEMTAADQDHEEVQAALAENLLRSRQFALALSRLETLRGTRREPQWEFWRAWALAATDRRDEALAALAQVRREFPQSTWSDGAERLANVLEHDDQARATHLQLLDGVLGALQSSPPERVELTVETAATTYAVEVEGDESSGAEAGRAAEARHLAVRLDLPRDAFEIVARAGSRSLLAYETGADGGRFHLGDDPTIRNFSGRGLCPLLTFATPLSSTGQLAFQFSFATTTQGSGAVAQSLRNLLSLPVLATATERRELPRHLAHLGLFPELPRSDGQETVLAWVQPEVDQPAMARYEVRLSRDQRLVAISWNKVWQITKIRYGTREELKFSPLPWPERPLAPASDMTPADFFRLLSAISSMMNAP